MAASDGPTNVRVSARGSRIWFIVVPMPRPASKTHRTTLYRVSGALELTSAIQEKYLQSDLFTSESVKVGNRDALLVHGAVVKDLATWCGVLSGLSSVDIEIGNKTASGVLVIRADHESEDAWALTYGMGFQLLDQDRIDSGFGQRIAIRVIDPSELNSVTRVTLDQRSRTDRSSIPSGDDLRGFGVGELGEMVTRLVARAELPGLTVGNESVRIRAADSLNLPLSKNATELVSELDSIGSILDTSPVPGLELLEQLVAVRRNPELLSQLESSLAVALSDPTAARIGLSWPHERIDENGVPSSYRFYGAGRHNSEIRDGTPEFADILSVLADDTVEASKKVKIQLFRDTEGDEPITGSVPLHRWIAFEADVNGRRYCLHDGSWYLMDSDYANLVRQRIEGIFARTPPVSLPDWPLSKTNEDAYNKYAAKEIGGIVLDKKLIRTELHRRGIEPCDILSDNDEYIHVKSIESSAPASHLIAQALVSTDALIADEQARSALASRVKTIRKSSIGPAFPLRTVILGIARKKKRTKATDLFTFTQVNLIRNVAALESRGVHVYIVPILRA